MKSTIKIDYERSKNLTPIIKIIVPKRDSLIEETPGYFETIDEDVRDGLVRSFLHSPCMALPNQFFEVKTHYPIQGDLELTTIGAIAEENLFSRFRWALLHRFVPQKSIAQLAAMKEKQKGNGNRKAEHGEDMWFKINEFFDILDGHEYAATETGDLPKRMTIRGVFEMRLSDEERFAAFNNTPKYKWDSEVESDRQALDVAFDFKTSPEGYEYWNEVYKRLIND